MTVAPLAPASDLPWDIFGDREVVREQTWFARVCAFVNGLRDAADPMGLYWKARMNTAMIVFDSTHTKIQLDAMTADSDSVGLTASGGFKAPAAGVYMVAGVVGWASSSSHRQAAQIGLNGATGSIDGAYRLSARTVGVEGIHTGCTLVSLAVNDTLNLYGYQDSGTTWTTSTTAGQRPSMTVVRVR